VGKSLLHWARVYTGEPGSTNKERTKKPKRGEKLSWEGGAEEDFVCAWEGNNGTRGRN